ncbi:hypothetical protein HN51_018968 [Arachis hypogaea]
MIDDIESSPPLEVRCSFLSTTTTIEPTTTESQILQHCRDASLSKAVTLLNKTHSISSSHKSIIYASLLQTSTKTHSFLHGTVLHCHVIMSGLDTDRFVGNSLLALYFKLAPHFYQARRIFEGLLFKDVISWTSIISGYVHVGDPKSSLILFSLMVGFEGLQPNAFTLSAVIKACSELGLLRLGRCFQGLL